MRRTPFDSRSPFSRFGRFYSPGGGYIITATLKPSGVLYDGENAADDLANIATFTDTANYASTAGTIVSAEYQINESTFATDTVLSASEVLSILVTDSVGNTRRFTIGTVQDIAPTQNAAPTASGAAVEGGSLTGTVGTFNGTNVSVATMWQVSDDGSTGWTNTGTTATTFPSQVLGKYYRYASTGTNSAGSLTTYSNVIGPAVAASITASVTPASSALYEGQDAEDTTNWATWVNTANYSSTAGSIVSAVATVTINSVSAASIDVLAEDDVLDFYITVTDSEANVAVFHVDSVVVQYKVRVNSTAGNEADIDINPLVADGVALGDIVISAGDYAGTYSGITAGDLRNNAYNFAGTVAITYSGLEADLTIDSVLTADDGLWTTPTESLTLSRQWQSDGVDITGETGATFTITADEQDTDVTVEVTGDDGTHTPVVTESAAVAVPAGGAPLSVTEVLAPVFDDESGATTITNTIPAGAADATKVVYVLLNWQQQGTVGNPVVTVGGNSTTTVAIQATDVNACAAIYKIAASAGGNLALSIAKTNGDWRGLSYAAYTAINSASDLGDQAYSASYGALDLSNNVTAGSVALATASMRAPNTTGTFTPTGLDVNVESTTLSTRKGAFFDASIATTENPRTMVITPTGDGSGAVAAALVVIS